MNIYAYKNIINKLNIGTLKIDIGKMLFKLGTINVT